MGRQFFRKENTNIKLTTLPWVQHYPANPATMYLGQKNGVFPGRFETSRLMYQITVKVLHSTDIPHICHGPTGQARGEKICHVEKFQISVHETCGES